MFEEAGANNEADAELLRVCLRLSDYQHERIVKFTINQVLYSHSLVLTLYSLYDYAYRGRVAIIDSSVASRQISSNIRKQESAIVLVKSRSPQEIRSKPSQPTTHTAATKCIGCSLLENGAGSRALFELRAAKATAGSVLILAHLRNTEQEPPPLYMRLLLYGRTHINPVSFSRSQAVLSSQNAAAPSGTDPNALVLNITRRRRRHESRVIS